jgi:membrane protein implicated in regulation of membrane protease activity
VFPLLGLILSVSSQRAYGPDFVVRLLRGMVLGRFSFAAFCLCLIWTLPGQNAEIAFLISSLASVTVQWASRRIAAALRRAAA